MIPSSSSVPLHPPQSLRQYLNGKFQEMKQRGDNIVSLKSNIPNLFEGITSPNEFSGPLVEAWAHFQLAKCFEHYHPATAGRQEFADATVEYQGQLILLNIKAKDREMERRSRINLSSLTRYREHYGSPNPTPFYVLVCQYEWRTSPDELTIVIEGFKYTFDLLEIPSSNYKIEGSYEGSYRIFISPIPSEAMTESTIYSAMSPNDFLQRLENLKTAYDTNRASKRLGRNRA